MEPTSKKAIYSIIEKPGTKPFWLRLGWANLNHDGSFNLHLDALPLNGKLQMRDYTPTEWQPRNRDDAPTTDDRRTASA